MIFCFQAGKNRHEHIMEALELFGREVLPEFAERDEKLDRDKQQRLAPGDRRGDGAQARRGSPAAARRDDYAFPAMPRAMADRAGSDDFQKMLDDFAAPDRASAASTASSATGNGYAVPGAQNGGGVSPGAGHAGCWHSPLLSTESREVPDPYEMPSVAFSVTQYQWPLGLRATSNTSLRSWPMTPTTVLLAASIGPKRTFGDERCETRGRDRV